MAAKGTVKYAGYKTRGYVKPTGLKNKRRRAVRLIAEALEREKMERQARREALEMDYAEEWAEYQGR